ncbi:MAG TPA: acetate/propionate family kinase [Solirubrobacterales bacterium]|nr:acetate/propionate family kinase [Solirubrobacterales bacterium]
MTGAARILTVNAGSSSLKLRLLGPDDEVLATRDGAPGEDPDSLREELRRILDAGPAPDAAAHRVVHGGAAFDRATAIDAGVEDALARLAELAPLHNPQAVRAIRALTEVRPDLPDVACFDTAFHAGLPAAARTYAVPAAWTGGGGEPLRRYGFHGLSHAYASRRAAELLGAPAAELRLVTAHLGAGASLAAVAGGRSVDTTMGFTPLEGLVMATRAGSVDPGLLLWVQRHHGLDPDETERALDREAGLLGLAGTADMREIVAAAARGEERPALALDVYVHRLAASIAAMAAAMGGLDALVFTGGVGENAPAVRERACAAAGFLGVGLDPARNERGAPDTVLSPPGTAVAVVLVAAREDVEMARQARELLGA